MVKAKEKEGCTLSLGDVVQHVLITEADAVHRVAERCQDGLVQAVELIHKRPGTLIISGVGKSGHICRKIASTFCSLGKCASFLHAAEASHGDLGLVDPQSVVLVISNSGETTELSDLLAYCCEYQIPIIGITASAQSTLGKASKIVIDYGKLEEACMNGLAPTTSTTVALALGDALAVGVSHLSGIRPQDFRRFHPGGKLGVLLLKAGDLMHKGAALPIVPPDMAMKDVVIVMSEKGFGTAIVSDGDTLMGVITDGDMRRNVDRLWQVQAVDLVFGTPKTVRPTTPAVEALQIMNASEITSVLVTDDNGALMGLLHIHDCLRAGVGA